MYSTSSYVNLEINFQLEKKPYEASFDENRKNDPSYQMGRMTYVRTPVK